jgi:hypothetical protein
MTTAVIQQTNAAPAVPEQHKIFSQDAHEFGWLFFREFLSDANWQPIPAQQFTCRRAGTDSG